MKNVWLHGLYLSIIGILAFQLYSTIKARDLAFGQIEQVLKNNCQVLDSDTQSLFEEISKEYPTNPLKFERFMNQGRLVKNEVKSVINLITKESSNHDLDVAGFKDSVQTHFNKLSPIGDKGENVELIKKCDLNKLIQNDTFWKGFKENPNVHLLLLKNQIKLDEMVYLNYLLDKVYYRSGWEFVKPLLIIVPKKAALIEGEKFEADISLGNYSSNPSSGVIITVNSQNVTINGGVGHFSRKENITGLKRIHAQANIRNPVTGQITTLTREFEYDVLPKCSQNCQ